MQRNITPLQTTIPELKLIKKYPHTIYYIGNISLLQKPKITIIGSRRPIQYTKIQTQNLSKKLSNIGYTIVSGAAMGVDSLAHRSAGANKTIAVVANGLDIRYPKINSKLIESIENEGLILSTYEKGVEPRPYHFVHRNEIVVALGECLIITQADLNSGSMRSAQYALEMGKKIYVLPHRIGESEGTNFLVQNGQAEVIYDIDEFVNSLNIQGSKIEPLYDEFLEFCRLNPTYDEAVNKFSNKVFEYELLGKIQIENGKVSV